VSEVIGEFCWIRAFSYSASNRCLFDSLVLAYFLRSHGVRCMFVMGVKSSPFAAHAWVQLNDQVLNSTPEFVRSFTPIVAA
jgi:hypothetical protein